MMAINLSDYEAGVPQDGDLAVALAALRARFDHLNAAHISHKQRSIILLEGWSSAAKSAIIRQLGAMFDPRALRIWPVAAATPAESSRHFLWRFWQHVPGAGEIIVFDRSWYTRVLGDRVGGQAVEADWRRAFDEINEFEAQLTGNGTHLIKLFVHVTQGRQDQWLADRLDDPALRWQIDAQDKRERAQRADYILAMQDMFGQCDTRWAPWHVVDGNIRDTAVIAGLGHIADGLESKIPMTLPDADPDMLAFAKAAFGYRPKK